ncbi:MAG: regulatory iron-sulfur-containing complex subunit RicT, partial [Clostridiaceae bacterium]
MVKVVGVRFKRAGKIYYFNPEDKEISRDEYVIVETARGIEFGRCVVEAKEVSEDAIVSPLKSVIRKAAKEDIKKHKENKEKEKDAFQICLNKIGEHKLSMKLIDVEYTFDNNKIIFYFTAQGRVDFRELVKDLATVFRTRIELRQIGVRDEAKMVGGIGPCGRILCCNKFLGDFAPVSI